MKAIEVEGVLFSFFRRSKIATNFRNFEHSKREKGRIILQRRTPTLAVSKWSYFAFLKQSKRSLLFGRLMENKTLSPSPHEEPNFKQKGDSNILPSFVVGIDPL